MSISKHLSRQDISNLQEVRRNLYKIDQTGTAPVNLIKYEKRLGLIKKRVYRDSRGDLKDVKLRLTDKGKNLLKADLY